MVPAMRAPRRKRQTAEIHSLPGRERDGDFGHTVAPEVRLGKTRPNGVSPSMFGLLERGVMLRPEIASAMRGRVAFRFTDDSLAPLRVVFAKQHMTVEDGDLQRPDVAIVGTLPDIIHFVATPLVGGIPNPARIKGLVALARVARRRVRIEGDPALARSVLRLLSL